MIIFTITFYHDVPGPRASTDHGHEKVSVTSILPRAGNALKVKGGLTTAKSNGV